MAMTMTAPAACAAATPAAAAKKKSQSHAIIFQRLMTKKSLWIGIKNHPLT
jgi:hypothetical protein